MRLDQFLVSRGDFDTRSRAAAAIKAGHVTVNGVAARKASQNVSTDDVIEATPAHAYVSRGGLKLAHALALFEPPVAGLTALDIGASTGGFTDVLLQHGAAHVYAVDVGQEQLHDRLKADARVANMQNTNARTLRPDMFARSIDIVVCDASFISLRLVLPPALALAQPGGWMVALIKPQFEVGRAGLGKNGVVSDPALRQQACDDISAWVSGHETGWQLRDVVESPISGPQGNIEYLLYAEKQ